MKNIETFINEGLSKANLNKIQEYINKLEEFLTPIFPKLNANWQKEIQKWAKADISNLTEYIADAYEDASDSNLRDFRGYQGRYDYNDGEFNRHNSCFHTDENLMIKKFNEKELKIDTTWSIIFSTCCEYLESVGYNDPMVEWTVKDFRQVSAAIDTALSIVAQKINK